MGQEIERKFLVAHGGWRHQAKGLLYRQGYIPTIDKRTVRVRIVGDRGFITIKGPVVNLTRPEFEYEIPLADAQSMLETLCEPPLIEKYRYRLPLGPLVWEIDEFLGANEGLVLAEVELDAPEQEIERPAWLGEEVTDDSRYYNVNLVSQPFSQWGKS